MPNLGQNRRFFVPCDLEIRRMTLKNNRAPLLCYFKFCASFHSNVSIHSKWSYSPETPNLGQTGDFLSCVPLKFDGWPWNTTGHLFYATSGFVHHFIAMCQFQMVLHCLTSVTLTFDLWPWPFAVIISWWYDGGNILKKVWQTDRRTVKWAWDPC